MRQHTQNVDLSIPIFATVTARDTGEFDTTVSHLTNTTAFLETMHTGTFGESLELRFSGLTLHAEVIFVSDAPMGWVVRFPENAAVLGLVLAEPHAEEPAALPPDALILEEPIDVAMDLAMDLPIDLPIEAPLDELDPLPIDPIDPSDAFDGLDFPSDAPLFWGEPTPTFDGPPPRFRAS
jgi:hypothetical protein